RDPAAHGVADSAAHVLGAGIDVHDDRLRSAADERVGVRGAERDHLVRADDELREFAGPTLGPRLGERLDQTGMIAAEVSEDVLHARLGERFEERGARRVVALGHGRGLPVYGYPLIWPIAAWGG